MAVYDRDYVTTIPLLEEKALEFSNDKWNLYDGDIGETLIKFLASTSHTIDFYFKQYLGNLTLPCDNWNSKNYIWELIGYKPPYIRADYLMVQLYWPNCGLLSYVPLYMYTPFKVIADGVEYHFMAAEDYLIPPMTSRINIKLVQGELFTVEVEYDRVQNNKIKVCSEDIDYDLFSLNVSGEKWTQVRNVFYSTETAKIYSLHKEEDGIYLYFHSTWKSYIDEYNTEIFYNYIISDNSFDDYTEDCLSISFEGELLDTYGVDVSQSYRIFPLLKVDTGVDEIPSTMEGNRAITTDDFTKEALLYPGVATCKAYSWDTSSVVREPFVVRIIAMGPDGFLRERTKSSLRLYLKSICSKLLDVEIYDPTYQTYNLRVILDIGDFKNTLTEMQIRMSVMQTLEEVFSPSNVDIGVRMQEKNLQSSILRSDVRILFVDVEYTNLIFENPFAFPVLGNVDIITDATSVPLQDFGFAEEYCLAGNLVESSDEGFLSFMFIHSRAQMLLRDLGETGELGSLPYKELINNEDLRLKIFGSVISKDPVNSSEPVKVMETASIEKIGQPLSFGELYILDDANNKIAVKTSDGKLVGYKRV